MTEKTCHSISFLDIFKNFLCAESNVKNVSKDLISLKLGSAYEKSTSKPGLRMLFVEV